MKVRILSFFLTLCMVLSVFPAVVFADAGDVVAEVTEENTLASLLADATTKSVQLTKNETIVTTVSKDVTIDLNGFELSGTIMTDGNVTIVDNSGKESGGFKASVVKGAGTLVIKNAFYVADDAIAYVATTSVIEGNKVRLAKNAEEIPYEVNGVKYVRWADAVAAGKDIAVIQNVALKDVVTESVNVSVAAGKVLDLGNLVVDSGNTLTIVTGEVKATSVTGHIDLVNVTMNQTADPFADANVVIEGGYYAFNVASYLTADYKQVNGRVVGWKADYVAYVGTTGYTAAELANLLKNANNAHVILVADVERTLTIAANSSTTIELNGYAINSTVYNNGNNVAITNVLNGGGNAAITQIINEGTVALKGGFIADVENYGKVVVDGAELNVLDNYSTVEDSFLMASGTVAKEIGDVYFAREYFIDNAGIKFDADNNEYDIIKYVAFVGDTGYETAEDARTAIAAVTGTAVVTLWGDLDTVTVNGDVEFVIEAGKLTNVTVAADATLKTKDVNGTEYTYGGPKTYAEIKTPICYVVVEGVNVYYTSIQDAVEAYAGKTVTIELMGNVSGDGVKVVGPGSNITFDFNGYTYTLTGNAVGSAGTTTQAFQIIKGNTTTFVDGTIAIAESAGHLFAVIIQNYGDLTIENMTLDGTNLNRWEIKKDEASYDTFVLGINNATTTILGNTNIIADADEEHTNGKDYAVIIGIPEGSSYTAPTATINTTGTIKGEVMIDAETIADVDIVNGTFEGTAYADLYPYIDAEKSQLVATDKGYGVAEGVATYVAQVGDVKYIDLATALADAANGAGTVTLLANAKDVVIPEGTATSVTVKVNGFEIENITKNNAGRLYIYGGTVKGAIVVNAGTFNANNQQGGNDYYVTSITVAEGAKLSIYGGKWYVTDASVILPYVAIATHVVNEVEDETGTYYVTEAIAPQASVVDAETKEELFRYASLQEAIDAAIEWDGNVYVEILDATATAVVDLADDDTLVIVGDVTNVTAIKDVDTYTTFETVEGTTTYTGHITKAIAVVVEGDIYNDDPADITTSYVYTDDLADIATIKAMLVNVYVNEAVTVSADVEAIELPAGYTAKVTFNGTTNVKNDGVNYYAGTYTVGTYGAYVGDITTGITAYVDLETAVKVNAGAITVVTDGEFTVETTAVINGVTYAAGEYDGVTDYEAKIGDVIYATVQDAINAAAAADGTTRVTVEIVNVAEDFVLSAISADLDDNEVVLNANGVKIESIVVVDSAKKFTVNKANLADAIVYVCGASLTISNSNTGKIKTLTVMASADFAATASVSVAVAEATVMSGDKKTATLTVAAGATVDAVTAAGTASKYPAAVTLTGSKSKGNEYPATVNSITVDGFVKLSTNGYSVVKEVVLEEGYTLSAKTIKGGKFFVDADVITALEAALATGYDFSAEYDPDAKKDYYKAVNTNNIVASVNGKLYEQNELDAAIDAAIEGKYELVILQQPMFVEEDSTVTDKALTEYDLANGVEIKYSVAEGVTVDFKFVAEDGTYYAFATEADGVVTVKVLVIVAEIDGKPFAAIEDAIAAYTAGDVINVIVEDDVVELATAMMVKFGDNGVIFLAEGKYTLTSALYDEVEAEYADISYLDVNLAAAVYYANGSAGVVSVKADVDFEATEAITFGVAAKTTLTLSGNAVVTLNGTLDATVKVTSADLKLAGDVDVVVFDIDGKANYCLKETETTGVYAIVLAAASVNGVYYETFAEAYAAISADNNKITLWENVTLGTQAFKNVEIDLNNNVLTVASATTSGDVTFANGEIKVDATASKKAYYVVKVSSGTLTLNNVTINDTGVLYDTVTGKQVSVELASSTTLAGENMTLNFVYVSAQNAKKATLNVSGTVTIKTLHNPNNALICLNHIDANNDHACDYCTEKAVKIDLQAGSSIVGYERDENGYYWFFNGTVVTLKHGTVEAGTSFDYWDILTGNSTIEGNTLTVVIDTAYVTSIVPVFKANEQVTVQISAPYFTVTGLNAPQVGNVVVTPSAGAKLTIKYTDPTNGIFGNVLYWINDNGAIVGIGNEIKYTVPTTGGTLTAICDSAVANESITVMFQNGATKVGTKVLNYAKYTATDVDNLFVPAYPALGTQIVAGWSVDGTNELVNPDGIIQAIKDAIADGKTQIVFVPAIKEPDPVNVTVTVGEKNVANVEANPTVYTFISAKADWAEGKKFSHWVVKSNVEGVADVIVHADTLVYKFTDATTAVEAVFVEADAEITRVPLVSLDYTVVDGKIIFEGVYQLPAEYTMTDAGIIYSTTETVDDSVLPNTVGYKTKHVTGLVGKQNVTYTLTVSFKSGVVKETSAIAFVSCIDPDGNVHVYYSKAVSAGEL